MITFVMPDLIRVINQSQNSANFPVLMKMLNKASVVSQSQLSSQYHLLMQLFHASEGETVAVAAVELANSTKSSGWSCVASPVMITPNRDHLDMTQVDGFDISHAEAQGFCREFNDYFKDDGFSFSFDSTSRWYCHYNKNFDVAEVTPQSIYNHDIAGHIPQGKNGTLWRKIFNETQMILHHSATNRQRSLAGKPEINSLWFWGGGQLEDTYISQDFTVFSDQLFTQGLSHLTGCKCKPLPKHFSELDTQVHNIIVVDMNTEDGHGWDAQYFETALELLQQNKIQCVRFYIDLERCFSVRKSDFYRFWKNNPIFK